MVKSTCSDATAVQEPISITSAPVACLIASMACPIAPISAPFVAPSAPCTTAPSVLRAHKSKASSSNASTLLVLSSDDDDCALSNRPHRLGKSSGKSPHHRAHLLPRSRHQIYISFDSEEEEIEPLIPRHPRAAHIAGTELEIDAITHSFVGITLTSDNQEDTSNCKVLASDSRGPHAGVHVEVQIDISLPPGLLTLLDIVKVQALLDIMLQSILDIFTQPPPNEALPPCVAPAGIGHADAGIGVDTLEAQASIAILVITITNVEKLDKEARATTLIVEEMSESSLCAGPFDMDERSAQIVEKEQTPDGYPRVYNTRFRMKQDSSSTFP